MPPKYPLIGIIGKTNVGKSTFFAAATLIQVKIENRPFVTIEPNVGIGYVRTRCAHTELNLPKCDPKNSLCIRGSRFIPVKLMDVAGLIKDAHKGRGLGNKFLDDLRQADVLLHIVDVSGSTDEEGNYVRPGYHDPLNDVLIIENEVNEWFYNIISKDWPRVSRALDNLPQDKVVDTLTQRVSGLSVRREHVIKALKATGLESSKPSAWREEELRIFAKTLREVSKPIVIVANKMDLPTSEDNLKRLKKELPGRVIVSTSAEYELALRRAAKLGLIDYLPGDPIFKIIDSGKLTSKQREVLKLIEEFMIKFGGTGVQEAINTSIFNVLNLITVYPVEDINKYTDREGNVLPDAYLVPKGATALDLAYMVHTDLGKGFLYSILARGKRRVGADYVLSDGDVIKVVSTLAHS